MSTKLPPKTSADTDPSSESSINEHDRPGSSCSNASEDSSTSFHSLTEHLEALNVEEAEFRKPEFMTTQQKHQADLSSESSNKIKENINDSDTSKWFDSNENYDDTDSHEEKVEEDKFFIDEEFLKDLELNISEENKLNRHQNAIEKKDDGNKKFKDKFYEEASLLYTDGLRLCPLSFKRDRAILYANRAAARSRINKEEIKGAIKDCDSAVELDPSYIKALLRRANLHQQLDNLEEVLSDYKRILELDPSNLEARRAVMVLPQQINEKNERLKAEMMGKLKDLGNMILKPFGLSTDNFQLNQNPETGGYNVNFNQKT